MKCSPLTVMELIFIWTYIIHVILQDGHMPLHAASYYGHVGIVRMLLNANADPNAINKVNILSTVICSKQDKIFLQVYFCT